MLLEQLGIPIIETHAGVAVLFPGKGDRRGPTSVSCGVRRPPWNSPKLHKDTAVLPASRCSLAIHSGGYLWVVQCTGSQLRRSV
jgi:hypothetical protein